MGVCGSSEVKFVPNEEIPGQDSVAVHVFDQLMLSETEVNKLYEAYIDIDADGSGFIRADEFRSYFKIEHTRFNDKLFGSFDADGNGFLNFMEFVAAIYNFLSTSTIRVGNFAFYLLAQKKIIDEKHINNHILKNIIELLHGSAYVRNKEIKRAVELMLANNPPISTTDQFLGWCLDYPILIRPVLKLQQTLRQQILGERFWEDLVERRQKDRRTESLSFVTDITKDAVKKYEVMSSILEEQQKRAAEQDQRRRKGSVAKIVEKARRLSQRLKKNQKVSAKTEVKKPDHQRQRRSFIKPNLKTNGKSKPHVALTRHDLYHIIFNRLLVVDDEVERGRQAIKTLRDMGVATEYVQSQLPSDALLCIETSMREGRPFEAVFIDGFMPHLNGIAVAKKLRSLGYGGIIVGMCSAEDGINQIEFKQAGANAVLWKPLEPTVLRNIFTDLTPVIGVLLESRQNRIGRESSFGGAA